MGKLTNLKPSLATLRPSAAYMPQGREEYDRARNSQHWRKWYSTARWRELRMAVLTRDGFRCQMCGKIEPDTSRLVADHKRRHGGDEARFFDLEGLQTLCKPCHDSEKQRQDNRARRHGG